jgi:hypothetical protein
MSDTPIHCVWKSIKARCLRKTDQSYPRYGGRGVGLCKDWESFENFKNDMYKEYLQHVKDNGKNNTSIERIDNDKGYSRGNCKWATNAEQSRNTRRTRLITSGDKTMCLHDWATFLGIKFSTMHNRLYTLKWPVDKSLNYFIKQ